MKELPIRKFTTVVSYLTEEVAITKDGHKIGTYVPLEAPMDKTVKKAIEPETVKETDKGKLTKGLGEMPWDLPPQPRPPADPSSGRFGSSRPAPKPGKK